MKLHTLSSLLEIINSYSKLREHLDIDVRTFIHGWKYYLAFPLFEHHLSYTFATVLHLLNVGTGEV